VDKPVAVVLGGTNPHIELIKKLKRRGFQTILVDYYPNPPAKMFADDHIQKSTLDINEVLYVSENVNARLVISACVDQANVTACYVAEKLGLPAPYSYNTALTMSGKPDMKTIMQENGIPTSRFKIIRHKSELDDHDLTFPLVVKPADSNGSKGVKRVECQDDLLKHYTNARNISRCDEVIIEEFVIGDDVSVDCFVHDGKAEVLMLRKKYDVPGTSDTVINCYASMVPAVLTPIAEEKINEIAQHVVNAFQLKTTPLLIQVMVNGSDVKVIEFAARVGGGLSYRTIRLKTGIDILDATIDSYLNQTVELTHTPSKEIFVTNNVYTSPGVFGSIIGQNDLLREGTIQEFYQHKTHGMVIGKSMSSGDRACSFIIHSDNIDEILVNIDKAIKKIVVYDIQGNDITKRDLFLKEL
jgi:biotin carboxylase